MLSFQQQHDWNILPPSDNGTTALLARLQTAVPTSQPFRDNDNQIATTTSSSSGSDGIGCVYIPHVVSPSLCLKLFTCFVACHWCFCIFTVFVVIIALSFISP
jgi:hypothetical protein